MADDQERPRPCAQRVLQPLAGRHIQVVGRLVEDQQVRPFQQQPGQQRTGLLPAAAVVQRHMLLTLPEPQARQHLPDPQLIAIATRQLERLLERTVPLHHPARDIPARHLAFQRSQPGLLRPQAGKDGQHLVIDRILLIRERTHRLLLQSSDARSLGDVYLAAGRRMRARQDAQQGGLADPVRPHQARPRATWNAPRKPGKEVDRAERLTHTVKR